MRHIEIDTSVPTAIPHPVYHSRLQIVVLRMRLDNGEKKDRAVYWITMRRTGDRLSNQFVLEGAVNSDHVKVTSNTPAAVAEHLQKALAEAHTAYLNDAPWVRRERREKAKGPTDWSTFDFLEHGKIMDQWLKAPLGYLNPENYNAVFVESGYLINGVLGTAMYIICQSREEAEAAFAEIK